ncbi:hypothetical protein LEP1GSC050_0220 [Leptospira broomii serovar Hurstbridge str. 5399]|uniref:Uncharacterized protein n=1 Tax=Leptospira broomii serovar Hurstbridge str. 5399 TaxID=1049789 RepID=T0F5I8_9LEPT|nr:hypothetical protein LEP1GSC050_0220 [Leptospira broomii serovar Hurstbridge str. 5399]
MFIGKKVPKGTVWQAIYFEKFLYQFDFFEFFRKILEEFFEGRCSIVGS